MRALIARAATGVAAALLLTSVSALGQTVGRIRGTVTDAANGQPIGDAQITIMGASVGGATDLSGRYQIENAPQGLQRIRVRRIGFAVLDTSVTVSQETRLDVALRSSATLLSQVVVTGTPQATERRTLGTAMTVVDAAQATERSTMLNVTDLLQSKAPGVTVMPGSGTPGTAAEINIRGAASFLGNKPIVYIDGVRYNTNDIGNFVPSGAGVTSFSGQTTSALDVVSPNDIESIEIIKGPSAATLYGAEAAGGVIQIITKKGTRGQQRLRWTAKVERGTNEWGVDHITNYTTCDSIKQTAAQAATWPGCQGVARNTILTDQPMVRDPLALREGALERYSLSVRGGGDRYGFYIAGDYDHDEGVFHNSHNGRRSIRTNFAFTPNQQLDFQVNVGYVRNRLRLPLGDEAFNGLMLSASRGKPGRVFAASAGPGWGSLRPEITNRYNNQNKVDRVTIGSTFNYAPLTWFRNRFTVGMDYTSNQASIVSEPLSADEPLGLHAERIPRTYVYTIDYAGSVARTLTSNLESTTSVGAQATANKTETLAATGTGLGSPDVTTIGSAQTTTGSNTFSENNNVGFYLQQQLGWKNRLYVTGAIRADDNSSFGTNFDWIVYPKASLSWVLSEEPRLQSLIESARIEELRFRTAWGQAGRAPTPYSAVQTYTVDKATVAGSGGATSTVSAARTLAYGNPDLKPERGEEIEIGMDVSALGGRVGTELTYYEKTMEDLIIAVANPGSTGFGGSQFKNLGRTRNSGFELSVFGTPVNLSNFSWEARVNIATNKNKLLTLGDLAPGVPKLTESVTGQSYATAQVHRVGYPLAGYWARFPRRNADGSPVVVAGAVQFDTAVFAGRATPSREIGFSSTFTVFKYFRIFGLIDYKGGHKLVNIKEWNRCVAANDNCAYANTPRVRFPQTPQDSLLNKELAYYRNTASGWSGFLEDAAFTKLRDLSLTITAPDRWAARAGAQSAHVVLSGHNLALWTDYTGLDPEVNNYSNRAGGFARADVFAAPMTKRYTVAVQFTY